MLTGYFSRAHTALTYYPAPARRRLDREPSVVVVRLDDLITVELIPVHAAGRGVKLQLVSRPSRDRLGIARDVSGSNRASQVAPIDAI